jgi:NADPH:quinone reductase-like Zn-dependent oxidoreductase
VVEVVRLARIHTDSRRTARPARHRPRPISRLGGRRVALPIARARKDDVLLLKQLLEVGEYRAVIDRTHRLEDVVAASRSVETQQKTGKVVLTISGDGKTSADKECGRARSCRRGRRRCPSMQH